MLTLVQVLGVFLTAAYMVVKGRIFMRALKLWRSSFYKLLQSTRWPGLAWDLSSCWPGTARPPTLSR